SDLSTAITAIIGSSIVCIVFIASWFTLKFFTIDLDLALFLKSINLIIQTLIFNEIFKFALVPLLLMNEIKQISYSASFNDNLQQATYFKISEISNISFVLIASLIFAYSLFKERIS